MEDQYGIPDLRQYMSGGTRPLFQPIPPPPDLLSGSGGHHHRGLTPSQHYPEMVLVGRQVINPHDMVPGGSSGHRHDFQADNSTAGVAATSASLGFSGLEIDTGAGFGADGGTGRWPRQETLTLLEIRSRLDPKFKEANQKGPLWDEVSRIMSEEHGYQRSGKKCREKFENLYKYYKKTKEGKAGRQDGKHYRFFRQLEALCGETGNNAASASDNHLMGSCSYVYNTTPNQELGFQVNNPKVSDSLSLSHSSADDFDSNSSEDSDNLDNNESSEKRKMKRRGGGGRRTWKAKIKDFIDSKMRKLMEKQEAWLEKMMSTIERKEQERELREEEWRKQETSRIEREHKFWANERAWIEARDATLMDTLRKFTGKELVIRASDHDHNHNSWEEFETTRLIQLRTSMEPRFLEINMGGCGPEQILWEEIAEKMVCFGYDRNALMCKEKWDSISNYLIKCTKKRKENSRFFHYNLTNDLSINNRQLQQGGGNYSSDTIDQGHESARNVQNDQQGRASPPNSDASYRYLMGDNDNLWENYGIKFSKGDNH